MTALNPWLIAPTEHSGWLRSLSEYNRRPLVGYNFIAGMVPSNGTDATNDIDFTAGACVSNNGNVFPVSATTKRLDATFAAGTNAGGLAAGLSVSNTTYHAYALWGPKTRNSDVGFDTSLTAANLIADGVAVKLGLTEYRRIFSFYRTGGANVLFNAVERAGGGLEVLLLVPVQDVAVGNPGTTAILYPLSVPLGIKVSALISVRISGVFVATIFHVLVTSPDQTNSAASSSVRTLSLGDTGEEWIYGEWRTDTSRQIRMDAETSDANFAWNVQTRGWIDHRVS